MSRFITPTGSSMLRWSVVILLLATTSACEDSSSRGASDPAGDSETPAAWIRGTLDYRERIALTDRAVAEIILEDVTRQDTAAEVVTIQRIDNPGQVPIRYELPYEPGRIDPRHSYAVRAQISDRGRLLFVSDTHTPVLTRGAKRTARILVTQVPDPTPEPATEAATRAAVVPMRGMFRYFADAATFRDCASGEVYPVAIEGAYLELERAYLNSGIPPTKEMLVEIQGRYEHRPSMEYNQFTIKLIVDVFEKSLPEKSCTSDGVGRR